MDIVQSAIVPHVDVESQHRHVQHPLVPHVIRAHLFVELSVAFLFVP